MSNALTTRNSAAMLPDAATWQSMMTMAEELVKSGMLPAHIKTSQAAVAIIQKGRELDIPPMYALSNIIHIQGKPSANSELMLALIYRDHGDASIGFQESTNDHCTIAYRRRGWAQPGLFTFTIQDAETAGLLKNPTWRSYPAAMLRARAISAVARMAFPDTIGGMYTPEELGATVDADGDVIDIPSATLQPRRSTPEAIAAAPTEVIDAETGEIRDAGEVSADDVGEWLDRMEAQFGDIETRTDLETLWRAVREAGYAQHQRMRAAAQAAGARIANRTPLGV